MKIKIENFEGPLDLLVKLIEDEELDITQISLVQVAEQYIGYLEQVENRRPEMLADFLLVASKLLYIKSKVLLPELMSVGEEEDAAELEAQLKMYKKYYDASKKIDELFYRDSYAFNRLKNTRIAARFVPPKSLTDRKLRLIYGEIVKSFEAVKKLPRQSIKKIISIKEKMEKIRNLLKIKTAPVTFGDFLDEGHSQDVIVSFLGMLELIKQAQLEVRQEGMFGEIIIEANIRK